MIFNRNFFTYLSYMKFFTFFSIFILYLFINFKVLAQDSASIIMYHRFGNSNYPSTNIQMERFKQHILELKNDKYTVLSLKEIISRLRSGKELPKYTVGLSIDDAFISVYKNAWPILKEANLTFTLFVATDPVDQGLSGYMTWDQIRELKKYGVEIGSQTKSHPHLHLLSKDEVRREIDLSNQRFIDELGEKPELFAYPYGEYNNATRKIAEEKFIASFGQHSGALHASHGFHDLPRFAMNENYGSIDRFILAASSLPFIISEINPEDPVIKANPPSYGFTLEKNFENIKQIQCFTSGIGEAEVTVIGKRVEVRFSKSFFRPRHRVNCTMPASEGRWRWFGRQFLLN